jgi:hypothetical protein
MACIYNAESYIILILKVASLDRLAVTYKKRFKKRLFLAVQFYYCFFNHSRCLRSKKFMANLSRAIGLDLLAFIFGLFAKIWYFFSFFKFEQNE